LCRTCGRCAFPVEARGNLRINFPAANPFPSIIYNLHAVKDAPESITQIGNHVERTLPSASSRARSELALSLPKGQVLSACR
jgi:hypothetical protein